MGAMSGSNDSPDRRGCADPWWALRRHTPARIALGRSGSGLPTHELLRLAAAHAQARDAVHVPLDTPALATQLQAGGWLLLQVRSRASNRADYLRRPDWGRRGPAAGRLGGGKTHKRRRHRRHPPRGHQHRNCQQRKPQHRQPRHRAQHHAKLRGQPGHHRAQGGRP
jgi:hypothetical protein